MTFALTSRLRCALAAASFTFLALTQVGCSKKIGDPCTLAADCGIQNNRQCDTAQSGGYCTQIGCSADGCPDEAACFLFGPRIPGCSYDDREPARTSRPFCMRSCDGDGDCRVGYVCADVTQEPWSAVLLDVEELKPKACIVPATFAEGGPTDNEEPAICKPVAPGVADSGSETDAGDEETDSGSDDDASP